MADDATEPALLDLAVDAGPTTTIRVSGDLDPATAPQLEAAITDVIAADGLNRLVLDLGAVSFLDSSGLRVFVSAREALAAKGAELALRSPSDNVRRLLDITGLGEVIAVE